MNGQHFGAFFWLHWRIRVNQLKRGGLANVVLLAILAVGAVLLAAVLFVGFLLIGLFTMPQAPPPVLMYVWDGLVLGFLFFWLIGLVTELQRSEALSLDKFLHLPVSLSSVFLLNYLGSLLSLTLIVMLPPMLGLSIGLVFGRGPSMFLLLPLLAAFLLMVTAVTYQFRGWLASLMVNKRRRRTIIVLVTVGFVLLFQLPNLVNIFWSRERKPSTELLTKQNQELAELRRSLAAREITAVEYTQRQQEVIRRYDMERRKRNQQQWEQAAGTIWIANLVIPLGWLPWGAMATAEGNVLYALAAILGMSLIGVASLRRAYRTTLRLYTGEFTASKKTEVVAPAATGKERPGLLEKNLPWLSEQAAAVTLSSFRSLLRAPEVKMLLLSPVLMLVIFGGMVLRSEFNPPQAIRPLMAAGVQAMILLSIVQLVGNQFGFDRSGFRVFVLSPASRKDILLGKNLAIAPMAGVLGTVATLLAQVAYPLRLDHFLALWPQLISMYLLFCLLANCLSIVAPMPTAQGTLKPTNTRLIPILLHLAFFCVVFPLAVMPTMLPLGVEFVVTTFSGIEGVPICLLLSVVECALVICLYRWLVTWQGVWLQAWELKILETVTAKAE